MAISQFDKYYGTEYVPQAAPVPFDVLYKIGANEQKVYDDAKAAADKFKAESAVQGGYLTQERAKAFNERINQELESVYNKINTGGGYRNAGSEIAALANKLKTDAEFINIKQDELLREYHNKQKSDPNYKLAAQSYYDPETNTYKQTAPGDIISSGSYDLTPYVDYKKQFDPVWSLVNPQITTIEGQPGAYTYIDDNGIKQTGHLTSKTTIRDKERELVSKRMKSYIDSGRYKDTDWGRWYKAYYGKDANADEFRNQFLNEYSPGFDYQYSQTNEYAKDGKPKGGGSGSTGPDDASGFFTRGTTIKGNKILTSDGKEYTGAEYVKNDINTMVTDVTNTGNEMIKDITSKFQGTDGLVNISTVDGTPDGAATISINKDNPKYQALSAADKTNIDQDILQKNARLEARYMKANGMKNIYNEALESVYGSSTVDPLSTIDKKILAEGDEEYKTAYLHYTQGEYSGWNKQQQGDNFENAAKQHAQNAKDDYISKKDPTYGKFNKLLTDRVSGINANLIWVHSIPKAQDRTAVSNMLTKSLTENQMQEFKVGQGSYETRDEKAKQKILQSEAFQKAAENPEIGFDPDKGLVAHISMIDDEGKPLSIEYHNESLNILYGQVLESKGLDATNDYMKLKGFWKEAQQTNNAYGTLPLYGNPDKEGNVKPLGEKLVVDFAAFNSRDGKISQGDMVVTIPELGNAKYKLGSDLDMLNFSKDYGKLKELYNSATGSDKDGIAKIIQDLLVKNNSTFLDYNKPKSTSSTSKPVSNTSKENPYNTQAWRSTMGK